jgi:hypothetical protein
MKLCVYCEKDVNDIGCGHPQPKERLASNPPAAKPSHDEDTKVIRPKKAAKKRK